MEVYMRRYNEMSYVRRKADEFIVNDVATSGVVAPSHHPTATRINDYPEPIELGENANIAYIEEIVGAIDGDVTLSQPPATRIIDNLELIELDENTATCQQAIDNDIVGNEASSLPVTGIVESPGYIALNNESTPCT